MSDARPAERAAFVAELQRALAAIIAACDAGDTDTAQSQARRASTIVLLGYGDAPQQWAQQVSRRELTAALIAAPTVDAAADVAAQLCLALEDGE